MSAPDTTVARRLRRRLGSWPGPIEFHEQLDSTNERLRQAASTAPEWSVVVAGTQSAGRGRQGRRWDSPPGGAYFSVLLRPDLEARHYGLLPLTAGVAVADALAPAGVDARLKWPNDVVLGGRKLAGILAEGWAGTRFEWVVVGIGINVNGRPSGPGAALTTSLRAETGREWSVPEVIADVLASLRLRYHALAAGQVGAILAAWRQRSVAWWGRRVEVEVAGRPLEGRARDVDGDGALLVETDSGRIVRVVSGEARELRMAPDGNDP